MKTEFDVVADILEILRFKGTIFFHSELAAPWGLFVAGSSLSRFHIALSGSCYVGLGEDVIKLKDMEVVMLPGGAEHWIADQPGSSMVSSEDAGEACVLRRPLFQQGEITNRLMCGLVSFEQGTSHPFIESLPEIIHFPDQTAGYSAGATAMLIDQEIQRTRSNIGPIIDRLTEVLLLQLLGAYVESCKKSVGFFAALRDPRLSRAIELIHQRPEINWTVDELGEQVGMSRATLNRHFQNTVGLTPMAYIQNWKMMKAFNLVKYSILSLDSIAAQLGFSSARTLTRAFQRAHGATPARLREGA